MRHPATHRDTVDVLVVGAGPAGMMAALSAARRGASVILCEQLDHAGAKLLVTGGGRCNLTNTLAPEELMPRFGRDGRFMQPALEAMDSPALRRLMAELGAPTHAPDGFHVYPVSDTARTVQQALLRACDQARVRILRPCEVRELAVEQRRVRGVRTSSGSLCSSAVILATGGRSYPDLGSTGTGYRLAEGVGHSVTPLLPVLVPLKTRETWPHACPGISIPGSRVTIALPKHRGAAVQGDVLFTHSGISGPAVLDLSRSVVPLLQEHAVVPVSVELTPGVSSAEWLRRFGDWQTLHGKKHVANLLDAHLPGRLARALALAAGIPENTTAATLTRGQRESLAGLLASAPLTVIGAGGFDQAMVTRGGVSLREVHPPTLESRLVKGLFFAGEMLNLDGPCGGYNLQWAFSSGWLAGKSVTSNR